MDRKNHLSLLYMAVLLAMIVVLIPRTSAETYIVGDNMGWMTPSSGNPYATWASRHTFAIGDVLVFDFFTGSHTVANVTRTAFEQCTTGNPLSIQTNGPARFTIDTVGSHYFICTRSDHCSRNQKLTVNAVAINDNSPSPDFSPEDAPLPSNAPHIAGVTFSIMFVAFATGLLGYYN